MPGKQILQLGDPLLWRKSLCVADVQSLETQAVIRDLSDTLAVFRESTGYGRGIAAPQIGVLERVVFIRHEIDHLDGILAVQRAISPQAFATRTEWERALRR